MITLLKNVSGCLQYSVPQAWNGFTLCCRPSRRPGEIMVDAAFYKQTIQKILEKKEDPPRAAFGEGSVVYCMLPRSFTAWNLRDDTLCPGTFLRALSLLPWLKQMGVDVLYMLPIALCGQAYQKGGAGSPYAIKDYMRLDPALHDEMTGVYTEQMLDIEFSAFVEACHLFGIKVLMDFPFRTCARDSELIRRHPDWFYWIDLERLGDFAPPNVAGSGRTERVDRDNAHRAYESNDAARYFSAFRPDPSTHPAWAQVSKAEHVLREIENTMGMTSAPAFPDVFNDSQPPWSDVTYLRYDMGVGEIAKAYVPAGQPPFVLYDSIKLSLFEAEAPNVALWDYVTSIIPAYIKKYGIDGARLDMAHALPAALVKKILASARAIEKDFLFWSESFSAADAQKAKEEGFDFISGSLWDKYDHLEGRFNAALFEELLCSKLPMSAALELPDTPRAALMHEPADRAVALFMFNAFLPNAVQILNSGLELMERQPMNLGLGDHSKMEAALEQGDAMYGKLALFDLYRLHWIGYDTRMMDAIVCAARLREQNRGVFTKANLVLSRYALGLSGVAAYAYKKGQDEMIVVLLNPDKTQREMDVAAVLEKSGGLWGSVLYSNRAREEAPLQVCLAPDEILVAQYLIKRD